MKIVIADCTHCLNGRAVACCIACYYDDDNNQMCQYCLDEHLESNAEFN